MKTKFHFSWGGGGGVVRPCDLWLEWPLAMYAKQEPDIPKPTDLFHNDSIYCVYSIYNVR